MADVENQLFTVKQGAAGSVRVNLRGGDVARAVKRIGQDGLVEVAGNVATDARRVWRPHRDPSAAGERRRAKFGRAHLDETIISGPTKKGSAFVRANFPAAFVELGHRIVKGGRGKRGREVGRAEAVPALSPSLRNRLGDVLRAIEKRRFR